MEQKNNVIWEHESGLYQISPINLSRQPIELRSPFREAVDGANLIGGFYSHESHAEAKILTVRDTQGRQIGYLMRATASLSNDAGYSDKRWFRKAATLTALWALKYIDIERISSEINEEYISNNIFPDSVSVLILDGNKAKIAGIESISQLDPYLFSLGFKRISNYPNSSWKPGVHAINRLNQVDKNIKINPIPVHTRHGNFMEKIFSIYIPESTLPLARFFYFYQLIELLIEEVAQQELVISVNRLIDYKEQGNTSSLREEASKLQGLFKEREKIIFLFTLKTPLPAEFSLLNSVIEKTLNSIGAYSKRNLADGVYSIRNQIFHNYRVSGDTFEFFLPEINELLEVVLPDLMLAVLAERRHIQIQDADPLNISDVVHSNILPNLFKD